MISKSDPFLHTTTQNTAQHTTKYNTQSQKNTIVAINCELFFFKPSSNLHKEGNLTRIKSAKIDALKPSQIKRRDTQL